MRASTGMWYLMEISNLPELAKGGRRDNLGTEAWENVDHSKNWILYGNSVFFSAHLLPVITCVLVCMTDGLEREWGSLTMG